MGKLRDQMLMDLQLCGAKSNTQRNYGREAGNLAKYFNRSPAELKEYLLHLIKERHLSSTCQTLSPCAFSLRFTTSCAVIGGPFILIQNANDGDPGPLVEIECCHFRKLSETAHLDPVCLLLFGG